MDKEALLSIILSDIKEVETLIKSFQGKEIIAPSFIDLTERKILHITEELHMLKDINEPVIKTEKQETTAAPEVKPTHINSDVSSCTIEADIAEPIAMDEVENKPEIEAPIIPQEEPVVVDKEPLEESITESIAEEVKPSTPTIEKIEVEETIEIEEETVVETNKDAEEILPPPVKEEVIAPPVTTPPPVEHKSAGTLGESLNKTKTSVNDMISSSETPRGFLGKPVADLTKGLGINDRFLYQRELFNGNADLMKETLSQLNAMSNYQQAMSFLNSNFSWDDTEVTQSFFNYVQRKF